MAKILFLSVFSVAWMLVSVTEPPPKLVGRWQAKTPKGLSSIVSYRADGTFDVFINGKTFASGLYHTKQDTLYITDPTCGRDYYGRYQVVFITLDSTRLTVIQDTCQGRSGFVSMIPGMGRLKATKP